jgi:Terminase RNaseH-like domain
MWKSWQFPTASSPFVPAEEVERAKSDMDEKTFRMEYLCSFEDMAGKVYYPFNREIHVGEYKFNPKLPIYIGQDFNIDPMSSAIIQPQPNGEIWIIDEIVLYSSNTQEVCEEIERRYWRHMANIIMYPDPAGGARQHARGETDLDIFREKGFRKIKYRKKHPRITDRVNAVNKMLMSAKGDVLLRVNNSCKHLIKSFEQTMYQPGGREIDKDMGVEHITDALGYCVEYEFPIRRLTVSGVSI